jgi:hypothetical protein
MQGAVTSPPEHIGMRCFIIAALADTAEMESTTATIASFWIIVFPPEILLPRLHNCQPLPFVPALEHRLGIGAIRFDHRSHHERCSAESPRRRWR